MRAILFEDEPIKRRDVSRELVQIGFEVETFDNLEDGFQELSASPSGFDLVVSDMYYPERAGQGESESGTALIEKLEGSGMEVPVVVVSSALLKVPGALACVRYSSSSCWEDELRRAAKEALAHGYGERQER